MQKKNSLDFTTKIQLLALVSSFVMLSLATLFSLIFFRGNLLILLFIYILFESVAPLFIIFSSFLINPFDIYSKSKIRARASKKISTLKNLKTIAMVGSYAKTSTKNMLYTLLWKDFFVVKTPKSFNTEVSIAKTIISDLKDSTQIFLVEMDAYHPGDIKALCKIAKPDMAIITAIAPQHLERFGSIEKLANAQFEATNSLKENGLLFLNSSDELTMEVQEKYDTSKIFYSGQLDKFRIENIKPEPNGLKFNLILDKETVQINLPLAGEHNAYNFLAAATIAYKLGLSAKTISERAKLILPTEHRLEITKIGSLTVIDNSYNTNPKVIISSLKFLESEGKGKKKILITPGLVEQGGNSEKENVKFMQLSSGVADEIIIVGEEYKSYLKKGLDKTDFPKDKIHFVKSTQSGIALAEKLSDNNSITLIENDLPDQYN